MQYTRYATHRPLSFSRGYLLARSFESPQANPFLPGIMADTSTVLGMDLVPQPGLSVSRSLTILPR